MRSTASVSWVLLVLSACGPDAIAEPVTEAACPIIAPTRLAAAPEGFEPAEDAWYRHHVFGDDILFTFDRFDDPDREYWRLNRCTGDIELFSSLAPGLHNPFLIATPNGRVLYGHDADGRPFVLDRFDVPGADDPRPVPGLSDGTTSAFWLPPESLYAKFFLMWTSPGSGERIYRAAGLGAMTYAIYTHQGDPDVPAVQLSDTLLSAFELDATHILAHEDSGEVHQVDTLTGERELLLTGVRHVDNGYDGRSFIWQAMGDDIAEPVYLHDLDTGEDVQIAVNDFAARSWNRDPDDGDLGEWSYTRDHTAAAMIGPGGRYVTAARLDTGEAVDVPEYLDWHGSIAGYFLLSLADDTDEVQAIWDPLTGDVREWYRGPAKSPGLRTVDGDLAEYFLPAAEDSPEGSLWRVDLGTGETTEIFADFSRSAYALDDTHYLLYFSRPGLGGPPLGNDGSLVGEIHDIKFVDIEGGISTPIAENVFSFRPPLGEGLVYLDAHGPDPGLWAYPLPR